MPVILIKMSDRFKCWTLLVKLSTFLSPRLQSWFFKPLSIAMSFLFQTDLLAEMEKEIVGLTERSEARKLAAARRAPQGRAAGILAAMAAAKAQQQDGVQQPADDGAAEMEEDRMPDSREDEEMGGERSDVMSQLNSTWRLQQARPVGGCRVIVVGRGNQVWTF